LRLVEVRFAHRFCTSPMTTTRVRGCAPSRFHFMENVMLKLPLRALMCTLALAAAAPALAAGTYVRFGNTEVITGPTKYTKSIVLISETADVDNDFYSYGGVGYLPRNTRRSSLELDELNYLSASYAIQEGPTNPGAPRFSIVLDVNRDGEYNSADDTSVFVSLGQPYDFTDESGNYVVTGNVVDDDDRFTATGDNGSVTYGSLDDVEDLEINGFRLGDARILSVLLIVDGASDASPISIAVAEMKVNKDKLNPKARLKIVN
jgi:hypothetical protein